MQSKHVKTILNLILYAAGIFLICVFGPKLLRFFAPLVIGGIFAWIANPLVRFFEKKLKIVRKHGSWLVIVCVLGLVIAACYLAVSWIVREATAFIDSIPGLYASMAAVMEDLGKNTSSVVAGISPALGEKVTEIFVNLDTYAGELIGQLGMPTLGVVGDITKNIPNLLVMTIFVFLSAYFFVADKEKLSILSKKILPKAFWDRMDWVKKMFSQAVGGYFLAQFKIMGVIAAILLVGFLILGVDYAVLWAILISLLDFFPFLGTGTAIWPWAVFQVLSGNYMMAAGLMVIYIICLLVHQLLQPKFVGDTVGMDSLTTLVWMFIGYRVSGVLGMILAVPVGIIVQNLYKAGAFDKILGDIRSLIHDFNRYRKSE